MTEEFIPKINHVLFKQLVLKIQDNEGNNSLVVTTVQKLITASDQTRFFDVFIGICKDYNVTYSFLKQSHSFKIVLFVNGRESQWYEYQDADTDITTPFTGILYQELATQILNTDFIEKVKKGNSY